MQIVTYYPVDALAMAAALLTSATVVAGCSEERAPDPEAVPSSRVDRETPPQRAGERRTLRNARERRGTAVLRARRRARDLSEKIAPGVYGGSSHTCHLDEDGSVTCWGLAYRDIGHRAPLEPPAVDFQQISTGGDHVCGIVLRSHDECRRYEHLPVVLGGRCEHERGELLCWGADPDGESDAPAGQFEQVSAGDEHTCAIPAGGRPVECWGRDQHGQASPPVRTFRQVAAGADHTCGLTAEGETICWGANDDRQLDAPSTRFARISAGRDHTCGRTADGRVECWGMNEAGKASAPPGEFEQVSAGYLHTCGLRIDGEVTCWGSNEGDVRCNGDEAGGQVEPPSGRFADVTAGGSHSCGLVVETGEVVCWGDDMYGETVPPEPIGESASESIDRTVREVRQARN